MNPKNFFAGRRERGLGAQRPVRAGWLARRTLRTRLGLASIALMAVVSIVIGLVSVVALQAFLGQRLDQSLTSAVRRSRSAADRPPVNSVSVPPGLSADRSRYYGATGVPGFLLAPGQAQGTLGAIIDQTLNIRAAVLSTTGAGSRVSSRQRDLLRTIPVDEKPHTLDLGGDLGPYRVLAQKIGPGEDILVTGLPLNGVREAVLQLVLVITVVSLAGLALFALIGAAIVRRELKPLSRVAATATKVTELPLDRGEVAMDVRVPDEDTDLNTEVGQVGFAINRMLGHVSEALQARHDAEARTRRFVADASHELRTPLASIRGYAELTRRSGQNVPPDVAHALSRVESEAIRMTGLVEELLMLARLDEGRPPRQDPVDLSRLLVDAIGDAHAAGPDHRWHLDLPDEPVIVVGDELQLHTVVANLLANARVHTPPGTTVNVGLETSVGLETGSQKTGSQKTGSEKTGSEKTGSRAVLRVADDGPGIAPELQSEIFERFTRGDESRGRRTGSTGLGLSIVAGVVASHGGEVTVASAPGTTQFTVSLPLAPEPATPEPVLSPAS